MAENNENANVPSSSKRLASPSPKGGSAKPPTKKQNIQGIMAIPPYRGSGSAATTGHSATATVKEEEEEQMENETGNLSIEVVQEIASNHQSTTYAGAAAKPAVDMKHLVYIQKGRERREPIAKGLFLAFMSKLQTNMWDLPKLEFEKINIDWSDHHLGRGIVACLDEETTAFVKKEADIFQKEDETVRAWLRHEFGKQTTYQGFLHSEVWGNIRGPAAIAWILKKNGLNESGKFQVISYQKHKNGVFVRFEVDDELAAAIDNRGHSLRAGICRVILKKKIVTPKFAEAAVPDQEQV